MDYEYLFLPVIMLFSVIQSIFGMGILVFGTPALLLLGYDFSSVLGLLLPSSVLISFTQLYTCRGGNVERNEIVNMVICAAAVILLLSVIIISGVKVNLDILVGLVLIFSAAVRLSVNFRKFIRVRLIKYQRQYVLIMGALHGITNMGGALLALYASTKQREKTAIRAEVSRYYLMFGIIQLLTLVILKPHSLSLSGFMAAPLALFVYWVVGNVLFRRASASVYEGLLTAFIAVYGILVLTKGYI
ncbi:TSUP family transporter [Enterobacter cloacae]|uniref:TSUP family transporter n=1 Tax=Enterobacter cloacae TaxID=550 RepID=UPI003D6FE8A2